MSLPLSAFIGLRYTSSKRRSQSISFLSAVTITGLAVGVGLLITVLSVMNGFNRELRERILGLAPQAAIYHYDGIEDWPDTVSVLEQDPNILAAAPFVQLYALFNYRKNTEAAVLYGFDPEQERRVSILHEFVDKDLLARIQGDEPVVVLGKTIADKLGVALDQKIMVVVPSAKSGSRAPKIDYFTVAGIVESKTELDASLVLTSLARAAGFTNNKTRVTGVRLKVGDLFAAPTIVYENLVALGPGYYGSNWTRTHGNLYHAIKMSKQLVGLLMSLIVAIAAFNVVSTLVLVVADKQGDIAILRTLGASTRRIMAIFMVQGTTIGLIGTGLGVLGGCLLTFAVQDFVQLIEYLFGVQFLKSDVYPLTYLPTEVLVSDIVRVSFTALSMSILATLYPAWKASRVNPAEALRYE